MSRLGNPPVGRVYVRGRCGRAKSLRYLHTYLKAPPRGELGSSPAEYDLEPTSTWVPSSAVSGLGHYHHKHDGGNPSQTRL